MQTHTHLNSHSEVSASHHHVNHGIETRLFCLKRDEIGMLAIQRQLSSHKIDLTAGKPHSAHHTDLWISNGKHQQTM